MEPTVEALYRDEVEGIVRATFGGDRERALAFYEDLLRFVVGVRPPGEPAGSTRLLDVGCGVGWSTFAFAERGYDAVGIDLNPRAFEPPARAHCTLVEGSATAIPFPDGSFDVVACYQCLEHVPDPGRALDEMDRACRPGGVVAVVGPNLVSPTAGLVQALRPSGWKDLRLRRSPGMPRHPYGNTLPEVVGTSVVRSAQLVAKLARRPPRYTLRQPDRVPPFHSDNDASYLCNPTDLIADFRRRGFAIERRGKPGRLPLSYLFAGGTWVAARKPG